MPKQNDKVYKQSPLKAFSVWERIKIRIADLVFYFAIRIIGLTLRFETEGWENFDPETASGKPPIYVFWHNRIFAAAYFFRHRGIVVITSQSSDGEYIARFIRRLGYGSIRGSSSRGGATALVEMIRGIRRGLPMAFTADGPKGPRYVAKPGPILLARRTGSPIVPVVVECKDFWSVNSWDELQIPKPFTRCRVALGRPIYVSLDSSEEDSDRKLQELQTSLDELVSNNKEWSDSAN